MHHQILIVLVLSLFDIMIYFPKLSIKENAEVNNVSVATVRKYIQSRNIDRRGDELVRRQKQIRRLHKQGMSIKEIMTETGYSRNTIKKYIGDFVAAERINKDKASSLDNGKNISQIKSYSSNQTKILQYIQQLYTHNPQFDCDLTYSIGAFYRRIMQPKLKFDKYPQQADVLPLAHAEYIEPQTLNNIIIDLPFLIAPKNNKCVLQDRFQAFSSLKEMKETYSYMLNLSNRLLIKGGYLIVKTQDTSMGSTQVWTHSIVEQFALEEGFVIDDIFILVSPRVMLRGQMEEQHKARKYHSYFYVLRKN